MKTDIATSSYDQVYGMAVGSDGWALEAIPGEKKGVLFPVHQTLLAKNGIYILGRGSFSIDQQRYNAQFGGTLFYEIKDGKIETVGYR